MKVIEINVDDVGLGGVYALVNSVIRHKPAGLDIDLACIARFENPENLRALNELGTRVHYVGTDEGLLARPVPWPGPGCQREVMRRPAPAQTPKTDPFRKP